MATSVHPLGVPATEDASPPASDTSMAIVQPRDLTSQPTSNAGGDISQRTRSRSRRSPSRPLLRTGFRNFSGVATVLVGERDNKLRPETKYLIHKELLVAASPFFAAALDGAFAEGMDQTVRLPEEKPEIFEWFCQWLYTGTLRTPAPGYDHIANAFAPAAVIHTAKGMPYITKGGESNVPIMSRFGPVTHQHQMEHDVRKDGDLRNNAGSPKYFLLLDLYSLSDRLLTTPLSNHILTTLARLSESTNSVPTPSDTWILYDNIRESASIRTLVLDLFAYKKTDRLLEEHKDEWHPRFLRELCVKLKRPGPEAIERHSLVAWTPRDWNQSRACELCKDIIQPGGPGDKCCGCAKVFCAPCLREQQNDGGIAKCVLPPNDTSGCKPWTRRGMCERYHEHADGEACG